MANLYRYFPNQALNFAFKDYYKTILNPYDKKTQPSKFFLGNIASGGAAGGTAMFLTYPLNLARTRLATSVAKSNNAEFKGISDLIVKIY